MRPGPAGTRRPARSALSFRPASDPAPNLTPPRATTLASAPAPTLASERIPE